jgi:hypothetical protein
LEDFSNLVHVSKDMVMGGRSAGTFSIKAGLGVFEGNDKDVPCFIQVRMTDKTVWPDVTPNKPYKGYRVSFRNTHAPGGKFYTSGYKATLTDVPDGDDLEKIQIPFSDFTDLWDDAMGDLIHTCQETPSIVPIY